MTYWFNTIVVALFVFLLCNCKKKENKLGIEIQPQEDQLSISVVDTNKLITYIEQGDSIITDELSGDNLLGSYVDPFFGKLESAIFAQIRLSSSVDFTPSSGSLNNIVLDSVMLYLKISDFYGNNQVQNFEVYRLNNDIYKDSIYYSNSTIDSIAGNLVPIGRASIKPNPYSVGTVGGELVNASILSIPLDTLAFGWDIINQSGVGTLSENDGDGKFVDWFKGLLIKTNTPQSVNEGGIIYTDLLDKYSKITFFYRDTVAKDTVSYDFNFNSQSARFHRVIINNSGYYVGNELLDSTLGKTHFFTQTLGGVRGKVYFPHIANYIGNSNIIVNKAELVLPVQHYVLDKYTPSSQLYLARTDSNGKYVFIEDFNENMGGTYDINNKQYVFNITRHINKVFSGNIENTPLTILPSKNGITANRVVFNGAETILKDKPKLKLTFTNY